MSHVHIQPELTFPSEVMNSEVFWKPLEVPQSFSDFSKKALTKTVTRVIEEKGTIGAINITLQWFDPNDLDLFVICPCGTEISHFNK